MNTKVKTSIIVSLMVIGVFATLPAVVQAQDGDGPLTDIGPKEAEGIFDGIGTLFETMFGNEGSGAAFGQVLGILFKNIWDFQITEFKDVKHVYVLNATYSPEPTTEEIVLNEHETYSVWKEKYDNNGTAWGEDEYPYIEVERTGSANITYEVGASIVFLIWDNNDSFVTAINKLITVAQNIKEAVDEASGDDDPELIAYITSQILEAVSYLFFHINDIINGDELIVLNMVSWESVTIETGPSYSVTKTAYVRDYAATGPDLEVAPVTVADWGFIAQDTEDEWMLTQLDPGFAGSQTLQWSRMTFNLIEIWLKTFQIHINVDKAMEIVLAAADGAEIPPYAVYEIMQGFEIDIYIITHSLMGFIAYDDGLIGAPDNVPTVTRETYEDNGQSFDIINGSEAIYYFVPTFDAGEVEFLEPAVKTDADGDNGVTWGIRLNNVNMKAVPVGIGPYDYNQPDTNDLDYIILGFTFIPKLKEVVDPEGFSGLAPDMDDVKMSKSVLKLDQYFADWGPMGSHLADLDFAVIYISTIIHFRFAFVIEEADPEITAEFLAQNTQESGLVEAESYHEETGEIKVGDETGGLPVAGVDIAGPAYYLDGGATPYDAATTTIPLIWVNYTANADATFVDTANPSNSFSAGGFLNIEAAIMIYAVSYPEWNGSGVKIDHDPTFSVFMTWDNPGFWAVILVVAGISLVAVAAILITRRKNRI